MCFYLFAGNQSIVNSPSHRELNPSGGSYSCNPFTTRDKDKSFSLVRYVPEKVLLKKFFLKPVNQPAITITTKIRVN